MILTINPFIRVLFAAACFSLLPWCVSAAENVSHRWLVQQ